MKDIKFKWIFTLFLLGMGFNVHPTSYFLVCNAKRGEDEFHKIMRFDEYLVPYKCNNDWIEEKLDDMVAIMNQHEIPDSNEYCKNCADSDQYFKIVHLQYSSQREVNQGTLPLF